MAGGAYAFLQLVGTLAIGWMWLRLARAAKDSSAQGDPAFLSAKLDTARFYAEQQLPLCTALRHRVKAGGEAMMALSPEQFGRD